MRKTKIAVLLLLLIPMFIFATPRMKLFDTISLTTGVADTTDWYNIWVDYDKLYVTSSLRGKTAGDKITVVLQAVPYSGADTISSELLFAPLTVGGAEQTPGAAELELFDTLSHGQKLAFTHIRFLSTTSAVTDSVFRTLIVVETD